MDPIAALSLAAAIAQLVDLGLRVVKRTADFDKYRLPKAFKQITTELPLVIDGLRRIQREIEAGRVDGPTKEALEPVVRSCLAKTKEVDRILQAALPVEGASSWGRRRKAIASLAYDKKLQQAAGSLSGYVKILTFHLVTDSFASFKIEEKQQELLPAYPKPFWLVPFSRNANFVGRSHFFERIDSIFSRGSKPRAEGSQPNAALCGLGGIGKSQIALEYCYRKREERACSVFWVHGATVDRFEESLRNIADECGLTLREGSQFDAVYQLKSWLETRHHEPWLMVIDNVDDDAFFRSKTKNGKTPWELIPRCQHGSLLFTTRNRDIAVDLASPAHPIIIQELEREEGLQLVRERLGAEQPEELVLELLEALEYIPLAISQAIAFIIKRRKTIQQYLEQYRKDDTIRTRLLNFEFMDHGREASSMESVAKTWILSFESIRDTNKRAADLLCLINFFQHHSIPVFLLRDEEESELDFEEAVALLKAYSFIDSDESGSTFSTHRLVQLATRWWLEREAPGEVDRWASAALLSVADRFPKAVFYLHADYSRICEALVPHAEAILGHQLKETTIKRELARAMLLSSTSRYARGNSGLQESQRRYKQAMEINRKHRGEKDIETIISTGQLGYSLAVDSKDPEAIPLLERLLEVTTEARGEDDPWTICTLSALATARILVGDFAQAERMQREAVSRSERVLGPNDPDTLINMDSLANLLKTLGKTDEAIRTQRVVYETMRRLYGDLHFSVLVYENNLALLMSEDPNLVDEAIELYRRNIETKLKINDPNHPETLLTTFNLLFLLKNEGRYDEVRELGTRTLDRAHNIPCRDAAKSQKYLSAIWEIVNELDSAHESQPQLFVKDEANLSDDYDE